MSIADRTMQTTGEDPLATGESALPEGSSAALDGLQVTWAAPLHPLSGRHRPGTLHAHSGLRTDEHRMSTATTSITVLSTRRRVPLRHV
jgi:hypothetical protein